MTVVETLEAQGRSQLIAFGSVIEHDIENDFEPGGMQRLDHGPELVLRIGDGVFGRRREPCNGVVAPVVREPFVDQKRSGTKRLHRQQLNGSDAESLEVAGHRRMCEPEISAPKALGHPGM